jgi:hypothetical protein
VRYLKGIFENISPQDLSDLKDIASMHLAYLIDDGFEVDTHSYGKSEMFIEIYYDRFLYKKIEDRLLTFLQTFKNEYDIRMVQIISDEGNIISMKKPEEFLNGYELWRYLSEIRIVVSKL